MISESMFDAINDSQDGKPLRKFCRDRQEDDVPCVADAISAVIVAAIVSAVDVDELLTHLDYAAREIQNARNAAFRRILHETVPAPLPVSWKAMQASGK